MRPSFHALWANRPTAILLDVRRQVVQRTVSCCVRALFGGLLNGSRDHHQSAVSARPYEWRLFPISRRVAGLTSAPCRSWRCKSRRAASWPGWFWPTRLARSRSGKSYEATGLCIFEPQVSEQNVSTRAKTRCSAFGFWIFSFHPFILPRLRILLSYTAFVSGVFLQRGGSVSFVSEARATGRDAFCGWSSSMARHRLAHATGACPPRSTQGRTGSASAYGRMLWLTRKRFAGSYLRLTATSRS